MWCLWCALNQCVSTSAMPCNGRITRSIVLGGSQNSGTCLTNISQASTDFDWVYAYDISRNATLVFGIIIARQRINLCETRCIVGAWVKTFRLFSSLYACTIRRDLWKASFVPSCLTWSINRVLRIGVDGGSYLLKISKTPLFISSSISLSRDWVKLVGFKSIARSDARTIVLLIREISLRNRDGTYLWRVGFLLGRFVVEIDWLLKRSWSSVHFFNWFLSEISRGSIDSAKCRFTDVNLKLVGPLGRSIVQFSPSILSSLYGPCHLLSWILHTKT